MSDLDNNLEDIQEAILNISGAAGTPAAEIRRNLRYYKMAKTDGPDAKLEALTIEIPIEAKKEMMDRLERNIFVFGQGIDVTNSDLGQKSGTALQFLYQNLDLKANKMEREFQRALNNFFKFVIEYINKDKNTSYTNKDIKLEFVRTKIADKKEKAEVDKVKSETVKNSTNILDLETLIRKHPLLSDKDDIEEIMKRVQAERSGGKEI
jgi:SPP1 family phage portal protein